MRISRRTSGGRGEYEIAGRTPDGIAVGDVLNHEIVLDLGGHRFRTGIRPTEQGGKPRLRRVQSNSGIQIHRQVAAALLLPETVRADAALGCGEPTIQTGAYAIEDIDVGRVSIRNDVVHLEATRITVRNQSQAAETILVHERVRLLEFVWQNRTAFPDEIEAALRLHESHVESGDPIGQQTERLVAALQRQVADRGADLDVLYSPQMDVLPTLRESLSFALPEPTITLEEIDSDDLELRRRTLKDWKRWANTRGPRSAKFREQVRQAYGASCVVCGDCFPATEFNSRPGVDAAHILPWSQYDLDDVSNGLCLCKQHHWAFDEGLLRVRYTGEVYVAEMPDIVRESLPKVEPAFSLSSLARGLGEISQQRLPRERRQWPRPEYLERLATAL